MLRVDLADEPQSFDEQVRTPGAAYLSKLPAGTKVRFKGKEFWRKCLPDLHASYASICAYTCHYIASDTGADTVEHFIPKNARPDQAYEWSNFRLVCARLNGRKGAHQDVIDPCSIASSPYHLDFPSLQLKISDDLEEDLIDIAKSTISRLKLNDERCINGRLSYIIPYCRGNIDYTHLSERAPFIRHEIERQGLTQADLREIMSQ